MAYWTTPSLSAVERPERCVRVIGERRPPMGHTLGGEPSREATSARLISENAQRVWPSVFALGLPSGVSIDLLSFAPEKAGRLLRMRLPRAASCHATRFSLN